MNLWQLIDRAQERRHQRLMARPRRPLDVRAFVGLLFLGGYYWMVFEFSKRALPSENLDLIRDAMLTLGPPVGIIVGAMFRTDIKDEITAQNTGEGFRAVQAAAKAGTTGGGAAQGAEETAEAAQAKADEIKGEVGG